MRRPRRACRSCRDTPWRPRSGRGWSGRPRPRRARSSIMGHWRSGPYRRDDKSHSPVPGSYAGLTSGLNGLRSVSLNPASACGMPSPTGDSQLTIHASPGISGPCIPARQMFVLPPFDHPIRPRFSASGGIGPASSAREWFSASLHAPAANRSTSLAAFKLSEPLLS
jgi:hypothetical protein